MLSDTCTFMRVKLATTKSTHFAVAGGDIKPILKHDKHVNLYFKSLQDGAI